MLDKVIKERREKALAVVDDIEWEVEPVECDDMGDPYYKYHIIYTLYGDYIWDDWFHNKPDSVQIHNTLLSSIKDGSLGDTIAGYLGEMENYDKFLDSRKGGEKRAS